MVIGREDELLNRILDNYKLNNNDIVLYPIYNKDKIKLEEILTISNKDNILSIDINSQITEENPDFLELALFIKEVEEFLLLEDEKAIKEKLNDFNTQYMSIATPILDMIFEMNGDLKILGAKIDFDSFMEKYRYEALEYGLYFLSETILPTVPKDTKKIYLASAYDLDKMPSYSI